MVRAGEPRIAPIISSLASEVSASVKTPGDWIGLARGFHTVANRTRFGKIKTLVGKVSKEFLFPLA
jgi:hypothetical protein